MSVPCGYNVHVSPLVCSHDDEDHTLKGNWARHWESQLHTSWFLILNRVVAHASTHIHTHPSPFLFIDLDPSTHSLPLSISPTLSPSFILCPAPYINEPYGQLKGLKLQSFSGSVCPLAPPMLCCFASQNMFSMTCVSVSTPVLILMHNSHTHTYIHACTHACTHTLTHIHAHTLTHMQTPLSQTHMSLTHMYTHAGHKTSIKSLSVSNSETYFVSASKDKTVKMWSLRNHGDGLASLGCRLTYTGHQKPVVSAALLENIPNVVSCDGTLHVRDGITVV